MAYITLNRKQLKHNYDYLNEVFGSHNIQWSVVSKLLCGNQLFLKEVINLGIKQICDSRIINIKAIRQVSPSIETVYIKPPAPSTIKDVVRYADVSCNTEFETLQKLSEESVLCGKIHKVIIMVELGELREGVLREGLLQLYDQSLTLPGIKVIGIGANFTCLSGVLPDRDKLNQLVLYRELIMSMYKTELIYVSGGSSVTIPLLFTGMIPEGVNHFRVGETLFFGTDVYNSQIIPEMNHEVFRLEAEIIEVEEKPVIPEGIMSNNLEGNMPEYNNEDKGRTSIRAILDFGLLDVDYTHIFPEDESISIIGAASDMLVVDLNGNKRNYNVGDTIIFNLDYIGACRLLNSPYIKKRIIE